MSSLPCVDVSYGAWSPCLWQPIVRTLVSIIKSFQRSLKTVQRYCWSKQWSEITHDSAPYRVVSIIVFTCSGSYFLPYIQSGLPTWKIRLFLFRLIAYSIIFDFKRIIFIAQIHVGDWLVIGLLASCWVTSWLLLLNESYLEKSTYL